MLIKLGDKGKQVKELQKMLDRHGFWTYGSFTENFGTVTETAVKKFQLARSLKDDGLVGKDTMGELHEGMETVVVNSKKKFKDTDNKLSMLGEYKGPSGLNITRAYLDDDEFVDDYGKITPYWFFLHHTAGSHNPIATANNWNTDTRGRIATQYIIGGLGLKGEKTQDGMVVECFPNNYLGWHLGKVDTFNMSVYSVAVEITNYGFLEKKGEKYYNYVGGEVPLDQVCDLGYNFRGKRYWHNYTDAQIDALEGLFKHIKVVYPSIPLGGGLPSMLRSGIPPVTAFEKTKATSDGKTKGTFSHTNVRADKMDIYPHPKLVQLLKRIY